MNVAVELPEDIARQLQAAWHDMPRRTLEAIAVEGYRSGVLTRGQVGHLLAFDFWATEAFLKDRQAYLPYNQADMEDDRNAFDQAPSE